MPNICTAQDKLTACDSRTAHISHRRYPVGHHAMLRSAEFFLASDNYPVSACAAYLRSASRQKSRKVGYLRLFRRTVHHSNTVCGHRRKHNILRSSDRRERKRYFRAIKPFRCRAVKKTVRFLNHRTHTAKCRQVQVYRSRSQFAPSGI